jgi:hypothetical protein
MAGNHRRFTANKIISKIPSDKGENVIQERVFFDCRNGAGRQRQREGNEKGQGSQRERPRDSLADDTADGYITAVNRVTQVTLQQVSEPKQILDVDGPIQAEPGPDGVRRRRINIGQHGRNGVARNSMQHKKDQRSDRPDNDQGKKDAFNDVAGHRLPLFAHYPGGNLWGNV